MQLVKLVEVGSYGEDGRETRRRETNSERGSRIPRYAAPINKVMHTRKSTSIRTGKFSSLHQQAHYFVTWGQQINIIADANNKK